MPIAHNIASVRRHIPEGVRLVCVSKFHPEAAILEAYACGERAFGESRVQELCRKHQALPPDIEWHFIGHLQRNKVKDIAPFVALIHGVDSLRLLEEIDRQGARAGRQVPCLLQIYIAQEETKYGMDEAELHEALSALPRLPHVQVRGLMGMASLTDDDAQVRREFHTLKALFDTVRAERQSGDTPFDTLSMGMSGDYRTAIEEGSTLVRIGTSIFGQRQ